MGIIEKLAFKLAFGAGLEGEISIILKSGFCECYVHVADPGCDGETKRLAGELAQRGCDVGALIPRVPGVYPHRRIANKRPGRSIGLDLSILGGRKSQTNCDPIVRNV
jgi:hypothetical protein